MNKILFAALVAVVVAGCSSTPTTAPVEDKSAAVGAPGPAAPGASTSGTTTSA